MLSSQSWPLQAQPQLLTAAQPTTSSAVSVQLSRSLEGLMQSNVPRLLTFSQQIRPQQQQLAVVTQKPLLSSVTRHSGQIAAIWWMSDEWICWCIHVIISTTGWLAISFVLYAPYRLRGCNVCWSICWFRCYINHCLVTSLLSYFLPWRIDPFHFQTVGYKRWPNLALFFCVYFVFSSICC